MAGQDPRDPRYDWLYGGGDDASAKGRRSADPRGSGSGSGSGSGGAGSGPNDPTRPIGRPPTADPYGSDSYGSDPYGDPYGQQQAPATRPMPAQPPGGYDPSSRGYPPQGPAGPVGPPPQTRPPGPVSPPPRGRRRRLPWVRIVILAVLAYIVFLVAVPFIAWGKVQQVSFAPTGERPSDSLGTTFLVVGSDSREGLTDEQKNELGTGRTAGRRTDSIMLLHVPATSLKPTLVSIPRDSYVSIPGHKKNKINAAFAFGGPQLLAATIEENTGVRIDNYVEIGFGGFVGMVDAVGGVDLCLPKAMNDKKAHINLPAGCQTLEGKNALGYVRARYSDPKGDLGRVERQQKFLAALAGKAMSPGTILIPWRYAGFSFSIGDTLVTGKDTSVFDMAKFAFAMRSVSGGDGQSLTVPVSSTNLQTRVGSAVKWDTDEAKKLFDSLQNDLPIPPGLLPGTK